MHLGIFWNYKYNLCSHSLNSHSTRHDLCFEQYRGQLRGVTDTRGTFRNRCLSEWLKTILGWCSLVMRTQLVSVVRISNHQPSHQARSVASKIGVRLYDAKDKPTNYLLSLSTVPCHGGEQAENIGKCYKSLKWSRSWLIWCMSFDK